MNEQERKSLEWEARFRRDEDKSRRRGIIATVIVLLLAFVILFSRGRLDSLLSRFAPTELETPPPAEMVPEAK